MLNQVMDRLNEYRYAADEKKTNMAVHVKFFDVKRGKGLVNNNIVAPHDVIFTEAPIVSHRKVNANPSLVCHVLHC